MARKNRPYKWLNLFYPPDPYNAIDNIISAAGNTVATLGLQRLSQDVAKKLGLVGMSTEDEIRVNRSCILLQRTELELEKTKLLSERQLRYLDLRIEEKQAEVGCIIIIDEAGLHFLSLAFATDQNKVLRALLMVCRQRHCSLVVAVQSSRDLEYSVVRQADSIIFREPGMHQAESERPDIKAMAKKATLAFKEMPGQSGITLSQACANIRPHA
jgi:hypothetical protein